MYNTRELRLFPERLAATAEDASIRLQLTQLN